MQQEKTNRDVFEAENCFFIPPLFFSPFLFLKAALLHGGFLMHKSEKPGLTFAVNSG